MIELKHLVAPSLLGLILTAASAATLSGQQGPPQNLQVLPQDISRSDLSRVMIENLRGLGLPRRQNEGCLFCHVGDMDQPANSWDFASDEKLTKRKARVMLAMVQEINSRLAGLEGRVAPDLEVTCYTCHAGRTDPRPLPDILMASYEAGGVDSTITRYRALRQRYFGADAYDFRFTVLPSIASAVARRGSFEDAVTISGLNEEVFPNQPAARAVTVSLRIRQAMSEEGIEAGLGVFEEALTTEPEDVVTWSMLDNLGWGYYRADRQSQAMQIFSKNRETFPDEYVPNESFGDALWFCGEQEQGMAVFEAWLERHPDHAMARRRLATMRSQR